MTIFSGPERFELLPAFGRPVRLGSLDALKVADGERVRTLLRQGDTTGAGHLLQLLQGMHAALVTTYLEWAYALRSLAASRLTPEKERAVATAASRGWEDGLKAPGPAFRAEAVECVRGLLDPDRVGPATIAEFRKSPQNSWAATLNQAPGNEIAALNQSLNAVDEAIRRFDAYLAAVRDRHDLIGRYVALYSTGSSGSSARKRRSISRRRRWRAAPCWPGCGASSARRSPRIWSS